MTDISDAYIEHQLFPTEDFTADELTEPPTLYTDAMRVAVVEADTVSTATYAVASYVDQPIPFQVVQRRGNYERKRVVIRVAGEDLAVFATDNAGAIPVTIGGVTFFPNAYIIPAGTEFIYESVAPLWCVSLGATTEYSIVSVLSEGYLRDR